MAGEQMTIRRESAPPAGAPFVGVNQLLYNEADGGLYVKLPDGTVRKVNTPPSDARVLSGDARGAGALDLQYTRSNVNQVASGLWSMILGGKDNRAEGDYALVAGQSSKGSGNHSMAVGAFAEASGTQAVAFSSAKVHASQAIGIGTNTVITAGADNSIAFCFWSTIGALAKYAQIFGLFGQNDAQSAMVSGENAKATLPGQFVRALGVFGDPIGVRGNAQMSMLVARVETTNATPTPLELEAYSESAVPITLEDDKLYAFKIHLVGKRTGTDENAVYFFQGAIKRGTGVGSTALVGAVTKTVHHEDTAAWDAAVTADATNGALEIKVTGEAAKTIRWVAFVEWIEVGV